MRPRTAPNSFPSGLFDNAGKIKRPGSSSSKKEGKRERKKKRHRMRSAQPRKIAMADAMEHKQKIVDKLDKGGELLKAKLLRNTQRIEEVRKEIYEEKRKRKDMGGVKASRIVQQGIQKEINLLENRINKFNIRISGVHSDNNQLVRQINALRRERNTFERTYRLLKRQFHIKQVDMANILKQSNIAYEGRQEALKKLKDIIDRSKEEEEEFAKEWEELESVVAENVKMNSYVKSSALKRKEKELEKRIASGNLSPEEEAMLKFKLSKLSEELQKQEVNIKQSENSIQSYEQAFTKLYESTGIIDINKIVDQFVRNEDSNFGLFNHIQSTNRELERDEDRLRALQDEMAKYVKELNQNEGNRERIVKELENRYTRSVEQCQALDEVIRKNEHILNEASAATQGLFEKMGCDEMVGLTEYRKNLENVGPGNAHELGSRQSNNTTPVNPLLIKLGTHVNEGNIMHYLGVVEQRTNEIIKLYRTHCLKGNSSANAIRLQETLSASGLPVPSHPRGSSKISVRAPKCELPKEKANEIKAFHSGDNEDEEDNEVEEPLSSAQIRELTIREHLPSAQVNSSHIF